jgi:hypothetical protein
MIHPIRDWRDTIWRPDPPFDKVTLPRLTHVVAKNYCRKNGHLDRHGMCMNCWEILDLRHAYRCGLYGYGHTDWPNRPTTAWGAILYFLKVMLKVGRKADA